MDSTKRIAVIGGGFAGMGAIFTLKEEGLEPVCFEKTSDPGGTWFYREEPVEGVASIMPTTTINHSKELGALSTFPPRKEYSNYMRHKEIYQYMMDFATEKDILKHIQFNRETISVKRADDYEDTGRWSVTVKNTLTGDISSDIYDGVTVCVGQLAYPNMPKFKDQDKFQGRIIHSHELKSSGFYKDQNVVVVGTGCSGVDAAVETSTVAKQVYLSTRDGAWVISRVGPHGKPIDRVLMRRYYTSMLSILPIKFCSWFAETFYLDPRFNHKLYNVKPKRHFLCKEPSLSDGLPSKLLSGAVRQVHTIDHFTENGVVFAGDDHVTDVDSVIMATGYTWKFPFLEDGIITHENGKINLYLNIFPPHLKHSTLAIIGFLLPFGPGFPPGELQCRLAARVLAGKCNLPSRPKMEKEIEKRYRENKKRFEVSDKLSLRVDVVQYMDKVANIIGVKPNFFKMFFTDIRLFWLLYFGPHLSYQYRLKGPNKWEGAREAIITSKSRYKAPLIETVTSN